MNKLVRSDGGMTLTGGETEVLEEKLAPVPLFPPQISHGLAWPDFQSDSPVSNHLSNGKA
jgi:hypothetical protein